MTRNERMVKMYTSGKTLQFIGEKYGVSRERVRQIVSRMGLKGEDGGSSVRAKAKREKKEKHLSIMRVRRTKRIYGCTVEQYLKIKGNLLCIDPESPIFKYRQKKNNTLRDEITWRLSLQEWWDIWQLSGKFDEMGLFMGGYVMGRKNNKFGFSPKNAVIRTLEENSLKARLLVKKEEG